MSQRLNSTSVVDDESIYSKSVADSSKEDNVNDQLIRLSRNFSLISQQQSDAEVSNSLNEDELFLEPPQQYIQENINSPLQQLDNTNGLLQPLN